jgi:periplasmic protein TonB
MKTTTFNLPAQEDAYTLDDIVFANRNREYGAYQLRKSQPLLMQRAFFGGIGLFSLMFALPMLFTKLFPPKVEERMIACDTGGAIKLEEIKTEQKKPEPIKPQKSSVRYITPEVVSNPPLKEEPIATKEELVSADPGFETIEGTNEVAIEAPIAKPIEIPVVEPKTADPEAIITAEVQPTFVGGMEAFVKFLRKNLNYPTVASRSNVQGRVILQFIVQTDGSIADVTVLKGIGFGCDEEALRVVKLMPKWKPGLQAGRAVRTRFSLPIIFMLE